MEEITQTNQLNQNKQNKNHLYYTLPQLQPLKRKPETPCFLQQKKYSHKISDFPQLIEQNQWTENDIPIHAFYLYKEHPKTLEGSILDQLLNLFYSSFPYLNEFIEYLKIYRKERTYLTKDEWVSLYVFRSFILDDCMMDRKCGEDETISWPLILEDFMKSREESFEMDCC